MNGQALRDKKYAFLGAGIIAEVFIERLLNAGAAEPDHIIATDINRERLEALRSRHRIRVSAANAEGARQGDVAFLAVPPGAVAPVVREVAPALRGDSLLVSLAAAVPIRLIEEAAGKPFPVVRLIPNTPSLVGRGMNPHCLGRFVRPHHRELIEALLPVFGATIQVEEHLMNAATALTAVGPTYVFPVIQALLDCGVAQGLSERQARLAAAQTAAGAAELVLATGREPDDLKLMIGTRTIDESQARAVVTAAFEAALGRIVAAEKKLGG